MSRSADLTAGSLSTLLVKLTVPMMFGIVSLMLFNLADSFFVAQLGTDPLAALAFTFPMTFTVISMAIGLGIGTSAILAKLHGRGEVAEARLLAGDNLVGSLLLTLLVTQLGRFVYRPLFEWMGATASLMPFIETYMDMWLFGAVFMVYNMAANATLRASGDTRTPALMMGISSLINFALDPLLIFGVGPFEGLGLQGAALASVIAWALTSALVTQLGKRRGYVEFRLDFDFERMVRHWRLVMAIGFPAALSNMMTPFANAVLTSFVASHGAQAVAAFGIGSRLESLSLLVSLALSMTLPPVISQNFGAAKTERVRRAYRISVRFAIVWQLCLYLLLAWGAAEVASLFSDDHRVVSLTVLWLLIVPAGFAFQAVTFLSASTLNALHRPFYAMRVSALRLFVFCLPMAWLGNYLGELPGMFVALVCGNFFVSILAWRQVQQVMCNKLG